MKAPNDNSTIKKRRPWLKRIVIGIGIILLAPVTLSIIGWLNRDTIIDVIQDWYNLNHSGSLSIGEVESSPFSNFPKISFTINDIRQTGFDSISDKHSIVDIDKARLVLSAQDLFIGNIAFEMIEINNAKIQSWVVPTRDNQYYINLKLKRQEDNYGEFKFPDWLEESGISYNIQNVHYTIKDTVLNKNFDFTINKIQGYYSNLKQQIHGSMDMDVKVEALGFNMNKGSYFSGQTVKGKPNFTYLKHDRTLSIEEFDLEIDDQIFQLISEFDFYTDSKYHFTLTNNETKLSAVKEILSDSITSKIEHYNLLKPFVSQLDLKGSFGYGSYPEIEGTFSSVDNQISIADKYIIDKASFDGYITSDIYRNDDDNRYKKSPKDIKVALNDLKGSIDGISLEIEDSYFQSSAEALNYINAIIDLKGDNESLATLVGTDNFDFKGGNFLLDVKVNGDVDDPKKLLDFAEGDFILNDTRVILKKNGFQLPLSNIDLDLKQGTARLNELRIVLADGSDIVLTGNINEVSGILYKTSTSKTSSNAKLSSKFLDLNSLITTVKEFVPTSNSLNKDRKELSDVFEAIYNRFRPSFQIQLDSVKYKDYTLGNVEINFGFNDTETIYLNYFRFNYLNSFSDIKGKVVVPEVIGEATSPIYLDVLVSSEGDIDLLENIFDVTLFQVKTGNFHFGGHINGNVKTMPEILRNARGEFNLKNVDLLYQPADINIELDSMNLSIENSTAYLKNFEIELDSLTPIRINAKVDDYPGFMLKQLPNNGSISVEISSPFIDGDEIIKMSSSLKVEGKSTLKTEQKSLNAVFKDINKFKPQITISLDSIKYRDLITKNLKAEALFKNDSTLSLEYFNIDYKNTAAKIKGTLKSVDVLNTDLSTNPFIIEFSVDVSGNSKDLNDYLKTTNFKFNSGKFSFNANYYGESKSLSFDNSKTYGSLKLGPSMVYYKPGDIVIPIDSIHLQIDDDVASLKTLDLNLPGKSSIDFSGYITNFSSFLDDSLQISRHRSEIEISSPYLDSNDIKSFLNLSEAKEKDTITKNLETEKIRQSLIGIKNSFRPELKVNIDSLIYRNLILDEVGTKLSFDMNGNFKIDETQLNYYGGSSKLSATVELAKHENLPIDLNIQSTDLDLNQVLKELNYLKDEDLRNAEKIEGVLNQTIDVSGVVSESGELDLASLNGKITIELTDMALFNYKPIMENVVLLKDKRFKQLRFQPIILSFNIKDGEIQIPRTEIQSTAIHFFIEGKVKLEEYINIWVSLPWSNLKSNDGLILPEKTTYDEAGAKFYLQFVQDKNHEKESKRDLKVKFRLSNRKLRKQKEGDL